MFGILMIFFFFFFLNKFSRVGGHLKCHHYENLDDHSDLIL